ncbi:protein SIEVE ELEMENT OCCLUSION B-like [Quillaja saponaria]|uniref:Protein SIEVE ELEMENT OCCLUSION B-like n=1 Tax=Quillaja saponaria TaxID=32244 RepID=A0AAD7QFJ8_QUISA|nr:protein SIEVE ELEMENT OCCLUSION B-like [Quillaja saponaria]
MDGFVSSPSHFDTQPVAYTSSSQPTSVNQSTGNPSPPFNHAHPQHPYLANMGVSQINSGGSLVQSTSATQLQISSAMARGSVSGSIFDSNCIPPPELSTVITGSGVSDSGCIPQSNIYQQICPPINVTGVAPTGGVGSVENFNSGCLPPQAVVTNSTVGPQVPNVVIPSGGVGVGNYNSGCLPPQAVVTNSTVGPQVSNVVIPSGGVGVGNYNSGCIPPSVVVTNSTVGPQAPNGVIPTGGEGIGNYNSGCIPGQVVVTNPCEPKLIDMDVNGLFIRVQYVLNQAVAIASSKLVLEQQVSPVEVPVTLPNRNSDFPHFLLKRISCKISCMAMSDESGVAQEVLQLLSGWGYSSLGVTLVLTITAFALDYVDLWVQAEQEQCQTEDKFAQSVAFLKQGLNILGCLGQKKNAVTDLHKLIGITLKVIGCLCNLEQKLSGIQSVTNEVQVLKGFMQTIQIRVIIAIQRCTTQITCLLGYRGDLQVQDLTGSICELEKFLSDLNEKFQICEQQAVKEAFGDLVSIFRSRTSTKITTFIQKLIYAETGRKSHILEGCTGKQVEIEVLNQKNVLLFISRLDVAPNYFSTLTTLHEGLKTRYPNYKILWIPIVEQWTEEVINKISTSTLQMPWHTVCHHSTQVSIKFIREVLQVTNNPRILVLNPQGQMVCQDAFPMIQLCGIGAYPFTNMATIKYSINDCISLLLSEIKIVEGNYTILYGGTDEVLINQFAEKSTVFKQAATRMFNIEPKPVEENTMTGFWTKLEHLFMIKTQLKNSDNSELPTIQNLLSYKNEKVWALLCNGSNFKVGGSGATVIEVVEKFSSLCSAQQPPQNFEIWFREQLENLIRKNKFSHAFDIPFNGCAPGTMECFHCKKAMEMFIKYYCSHTQAQTFYQEQTQTQMYTEISQNSTGLVAQAGLQGGALPLQAPMISHH